MFCARVKEIPKSPTLTLMRSLISERHLIDRNIWAVTLLNRKGTEHAFLIIEGAKETPDGHLHNVILRSDLFLDQSGRDAMVDSLHKSGYDRTGNVVEGLWNSSHSSSGKAFIRLKEIDFEELVNTVENCQHQSYGISADQAAKLLARLIEEAEKPLSFNKPGNHSIYSVSQSGSNYHNCVSWCQTILKEVLGIETSETWYPVQRPSKVVEETIKKANEQKQAVMSHSSAP